MFPRLHNDPDTRFELALSPVKSIWSLCHQVPAPNCHCLPRQLKLSPRTNFPSSYNNLSLFQDQVCAHSERPHLCWQRHLHLSGLQQPRSGPEELQGQHPGHNNNNNYNNHNNHNYNHDNYNYNNYNYNHNNYHNNYNCIYRCIIIFRWSKWKYHLRCPDKSTNRLISIWHSYIFRKVSFFFKWNIALEILSDHLVTFWYPLKNILVHLHLFWQLN